MRPINLAVAIVKVEICVCVCVAAWDAWLELFAARGEASGKGT